jgi:hypothetical protein
MVPIESNLGSMVKKENLIEMLVFLDTLKSLVSEACLLIKNGRLQEWCFEYPVMSKCITVV